MTAPKFFAIWMLAFEILFIVFGLMSHGAESAVFFVGSIMCLGIIFILAAIDLKQETKKQ